MESNRWDLDGVIRIWLRDEVFLIAKTSFIFMSFGTSSRTFNASSFDGHTPSCLCYPSIGT